MSESTLETLVQKALSEATELVSFGFQGGEPMLAGLDFFRALIGFQQKYNVHNAQIMNSIQTNGTCIDREWARFFAEHKFLVGLSIDGPAAVHDALRLNADGAPTHGRCIKAAWMLSEAGADFNVLTVITNPLAQRPDELYSFYKQHDFRFLQLIPCMDEPGAEPTEFSLDPLCYGRFLCRFFDLWYEDFIRGNYYSVRSFDNWVRMLMGEPPENCGMSGCCQGYPVIEADGSVYPCDFYVDEAHRIGHICADSFEGMLDSEACRRFASPSLQIDEACRRCEHAPLCRGGCRRDREPVLDGKPSLNRYCEGYKLFFVHATDRMRQIAQHMPRRQPT